jgi:UDP-2,3-diacylglucosamine pyrophosphatase LpxH
VPALRLAVISDLHCHPKSIKSGATFLHSDALRDPANHHPVQSLLNLIQQEQIAADALLVPGDLTNAMDLQGLTSGWSFVKEIARSLGDCPIAITLGNHDVDSHRTHDADVFKIPRHFDPSFPCADSSRRQAFWANGLFSIEGSEWRIVVINSVMSHHDEKSAKRGKVTESQLAALRANLADGVRPRFQVALCHHHPIPHEGLGLGADDLMENGSLLVELLEEYEFNLVVHGHKHYPRLRYSGAGTTGITVFASGSLSAISPWVMTNTKNLFHIVELDGSSVPGCIRQGIIHSWAFGYGKGWQKRHSDAADFPAIAGFGCRMSPRDIAAGTAQIVSQLEVPLLSWDQLIQSQPQPAFLLPTDFERYSEILLKDHNLRILRAGPGEVWIGARV